MLQVVEALCDKMFWGLIITKIWSPRPGDLSHLVLIWSQGMYPHIHINRLCYNEYFLIQDWYLPNEVPPMLGPVPIWGSKGAQAMTITPLS